MRTPVLFSLALLGCMGGAAARLWAQHGGSRPYKP
jgi:hypothetical protein